MVRVRAALKTPGITQRALLRALDHDCLNLAQSAAYSAMVSLFPALIVTAALIAVLPDTLPLRDQVGSFFDQVLPADVFPLLTSYFVASPNAAPHTARAIILAGIVSLTGASSIIATLMEGIARANGLPSDCWSFWQRRARAFLLVPLCLAPLLLATILVVFGQFITSWIALHLATSVQPAFKLALHPRPLDHLARRRRRPYRADLPPWQPTAPEMDQDPPRSRCGHGYVVPIHAGIRVVRNAFCQLQPGLRLTWCRHRAPFLAVPRLSQCALRRGVQHPVPHPVRSPTPTRAHRPRPL